MAKAAPGVFRENIQQISSSWWPWPYTRNQTEGKDADHQWPGSLKLLQVCKSIIFKRNPPTFPNCCSKTISPVLWINKGLPRGLVVKNLPAVQQTQETRFDPWVGQIPWRRVWRPAPVFLPRESHGQRGLAGYTPPGCKESDRTSWWNKKQSQSLV